MSARAYAAQSRDGAMTREIVNPFEGVFTVKRLAAFVSAELGLPVEKVLSPNRKREFALARALVAHYALKRGFAYTQIGRAMKRDHTTILHAVRVLPGWLRLYPDAQAVFDRLAELLELSKAHHAHIISWRAHQALPEPVRVFVPHAPRAAVVSFASKAELARFSLVRTNMERDERNRREGSALLSQSIARAGGWR